MYNYVEAKTEEQPSKNDDAQSGATKKPRVEIDFSPNVILRVESERPMDRKLLKVNARTCTCI